MFPNSTAENYDILGCQYYMTAVFSHRNFLLEKFKFFCVFAIFKNGASDTSVLLSASVSFFKYDSKNLKTQAGVFAKFYFLRAKLPAS
jgi:hypothetical protein